MKVKYNSLTVKVKVHFCHGRNAYLSRKLKKKAQMYAKIKPLKVGYCVDKIMWVTDTGSLIQGHCTELCGYEQKTMKKWGVMRRL